MIFVPTAATSITTGEIAVLTGVTYIGIADRVASNRLLGGANKKRQESSCRFLVQQI